ncbi:flagellar filament capping protein FliD [Lacrimispora sp. JR3]|uniref:flagellar filament capping protein FliD n=1 Tax=Lacrimispora sinapis TaxID=3111456 RepID=UPI003749BD32
MASISSSSSSTNGASSIRGYGGLASGLDRDSLIEGMTASTRAKIAKQQKSRQSLLWKQEAYQSISSKLVEFNKKYASYTNSSTNLSSPSFWSRSNITVSGTNSKYVTASGSSSITDSISILGVKQLAKNASMTSKAGVSDPSLNTGNINLGEEPVSTLEGGYITFKYGSKSFSVTLGTGTTNDGFTYDYSNGKNAADSINRSLKEVSIGNGKTLADVIDVTASSVDGNPSKASELSGTPFQLDFKSKDTAGNTLLVEGGSKAALDALGFKDIDKMEESDRKVTSEGLSEVVKKNQKEANKPNDAGNSSFFEMKSFAERLGGKSVTFTYNGTSKSISFGTQAELEARMVAGNDKASLDNIANDLQEKLNKAFGDNRIKVKVQPNETTGPYNLSFETVREGGVNDDSSILSISSSDRGVMGKNGALKISNDASNRLNMNTSIQESGLKGIEDRMEESLPGYKTIQAAIDSLKDEATIGDLRNKIKENNPAMSDTDIDKILTDFKIDDSVENIKEARTKVSQAALGTKLELKINGVEIEGLTFASSMNDIMNKVNSSDAGVKISYLKNADKFTIESTVDGAGGKIVFGDLDQNGKVIDSDYVKNASTLFGVKTDEAVVGKDAIVEVQYAGSDEPTELVRGSNSFNLDGLNITVNGTFGYDDKGTPIADDVPVTFSSKTDADKIVTAVADMVKDFNEIIKLVDDQISTKPNRDYEPLTEEQKKDMSEDQIKKWEEKAKAGMLFNDSELRSLTDDLRFIFDAGSEDRNKLSSFGITTSSTYGDNGKLVFDETKFRAALESSPEEVQKLFTRSEDSNKDDKGGVMARLTAITNKYAATTGAVKGTLIEKAGSVYAPTSVLSNYMQKSIDSVDSYIKRLQTQLKTETDRYVSQFTNLERVISQMNSQSSWLNSSLGG